MPTYRTNALYQAPTVDNAVYEQFGMQPGMDRLNLLPRYDAKLGWIAPNALYQIARAIVSPSVAAQGGYVSPEDGVNFAGNVSLGSLGTSALVRNPAPGPGRTVAQTVYHGSPHNFDKFDMSKIGTGEGAQAYGHGLYVAEAPGTARTYQYAAPNQVVIGDKKIGPNASVPANRSDPVHKAWMEVTAAYDGQHQNPFAVAKERLGGKWGPSNELDRKAIEVINQWQKEGATVQSGGKFYTVDLPDQHIANMLDWDKPLTEQPQAVKDAFKKSGLWKEYRDNASDFASPMDTRGKGKGQNVYAYLSWKLGGPEKASEYLKSQGIPGIRYLDAGSRDANRGTRNFVVFDDNLLKILKKE